MRRGSIGFVELHPILPSLSLVFAALLALGVSSCSSSDGGPVGSGGGTPPATVGPGGGTVSDAGGAAVSIPPGALADDTPITATTVASPTDLPYPTAPGQPFMGAARFGPSGTTFLEPVQITIPLAQSMTPGDEVALFVYDETLPGWQGDATAVVAADGQSAIAAVTHFSLFIIIGDADLWFGAFRRGFFDVCTQPASDVLFQNTVDLFNAAFPTGDREVCDFTLYNDNPGYGCYEVVGISFTLSIVRAVPDETVEGNWIPVEEKTFESPAPEGQVNLAFLDQQERVISDSQCGEYRLSYTWDATIRLSCTTPTLAVDAEYTQGLLAGAATEVRATLTCGDTPFDVQRVEFSVDPDLGVGHITSPIATTDVLGVATTELQTDRCLTGTRRTNATVLARYDACTTQGLSLRVENTVDVDVVELLTGTWLVQMYSTTNDCNPPDLIDPPWYAHVVQSGQTIYFEGFTGVVTANGVSWVVGYPEQTGWTTESCVGQITVDGRQIALDCSWEYVDDEDPELDCTGRDLSTLTKQCQ
jgi:hypothetical protein